MLDKTYDSGSIRRAEVRLRTEYWGIKTKIYLLESHHYAIYILNYIEQFDQIKETFQYKIKSAGDWVDLIKEPPEKYICEIPVLDNIAQGNEGLYLSSQLFDSLLVSRFPAIDFYGHEVHHEEDVSVIISVKDNISNADAEAIKKFVLDLKLRFKEIKIQKIKSEEIPIYYTNVELACTNKQYKASVEDAIFWFDNVEKIYSGEITKEHLRFFDNNTTKCYMDFSVWENNTSVNLRNNIMLYDKTYISFPLAGNYPEFLQRQKLKENDLIELVERDKVAILLPNTETRYDARVIQKLYDANPNNIVTKRGLNALMAMFYVDMEKNYLSFWNGKEDILEELYRDFYLSENIGCRNFAQALIWPMWAKNKSFDFLTNYGPMQYANLGVNHILEDILRKHPNSNALEFEFVVNSPAIHIATALQATYFPFLQKEKQGYYSDEGVAGVLGQILNMYQYANVSQQKNIGEYADILNRQKLAINMLNVENNTPMKHIIDYSEDYKTPQTLKNILNNLSKMDERQRKERVYEYNNLIAEIGKEKKSPSASDIISYILTAGGVIPPVSMLFSVLSVMFQLGGPAAEHLKEKMLINRLMKDGSNLDDEVYLLDKLSRVARITAQQ